MNLNWNELLLYLSACSVNFIEMTNYQEIKHVKWHPLSYFSPTNIIFVIFPSIFSPHLLYYFQSKVCVTKIESTSEYDGTGGLKIAVRICLHRQKENQWDLNLNSPGLYIHNVFFTPKTHRAKCLEFLGILRKGMCLPINSFELQETILSPF